MKLIGLTGSIASGKTTVAGYFRDIGLPVFDSDACVHDLYADPDFANEIEQMFPGTTGPQGVDRVRLAASVLGNPLALDRLEQLVHPAVQALQRKFVVECRNLGHDMAVIDVPLLFEKDRDREFDAIICVVASESFRKTRAMQRPGMTDEKWQNITSRQLSDALKRKRAGITIENDGNLEQLRGQSLSAIKRLRESNGLEKHDA